jgi:hypothetical protein
MPRGDLVGSLQAAESRDIGHSVLLRKWLRELWMGHARAILGSDGEFKVIVGSGCW